MTLVGGRPVFKAENFPTAVQTQVTGINDAGDTVGFEVDAAGNSYGFMDIGGTFVTAVDSLAPKIGGVVSEQFLGVNDHGSVAGFYVSDTAGDSRGFVFDSDTGAFTAVGVAGASSVAATDINDLGEVSGFFTESGKTEGFVEVGGAINALAGLTGWSNIQALGLNDAGRVMGSYVDSKGHTDGFEYNLASGVYISIVEGAGTQTVVNGINNAGQLVGFYMDASGKTHGMLLDPTATIFNWVSKTLDNSADPTFNQLLSINNAGAISGYFGSGAAGHPNKGYVLYNEKSYVNVNCPGFAQTQVTGINNAGVVVGFEVDAAGDNVGFVHQGAQWQPAVDPLAPKIAGIVSEQFLGVNDRN